MKRRRLTSRIAKAFKVLNYPKAGLPVGDTGIEKMLLSGFVNREAFKGEHSSRAELWLHGARYKYWAFHRELGYAAFHHTELECYDGSHLNGAAKRDLAIPLAEMSVPDAHSVFSRTLRPTKWDGGVTHT